MKAILVSVLLAASYIGSAVCPIWAVVEFILYLAKDHPFNWWSLWLCIIFWVLTFAAVIMAAAIELKKKNELNKNQPKVSNFQKRLEEMAKQRSGN